MKQTIDISQLLQLGFAGGIATYLVIFLVKEVKGSQTKIIDTLECILEAMDIKRNKRK